MRSSSLGSSEWLLAGSLSMLLASLFAISKIQVSRLSSGGFRKPSAVEVVIDGYVSKPGTYSAIPGTPIREVVRKARPRRFADLRAMDPSGTVAGPVHLMIQKLETVRVQLAGAVDSPGWVEVPVGTRICDLKKIVTLSQGADVSFFKQKRMLDDGQVITIPSKVELSIRQE